MHHRKYTGIKSLILRYYLVLVLQLVCWLEDSCSVAPRVASAMLVLYRILTPPPVAAQAAHTNINSEGRRDFCTVPQPMNQGTQGYRLTKKTKGRKSCETVPLKKYM
jgi:hypothetical protein